MGEEIVDLGIAFVPEGRRLFPKQSVMENLQLGAYRPKARAALQRNLDFCFETFPRLKERAKQLDAEGNKAKATEERHDAIDAFDKAIKIDDTLQKHLVEER